MTNKEKCLMKCRNVMKQVNINILDTAGRLYDSGAIETDGSQIRLAKLLVAAAMREQADNIACAVDRKELNNLRCF